MSEIEVVATDASVQRRITNLVRLAGYDVQTALQLADQYADEILGSETKQFDAIASGFILSALVDLHAWGAQIELHRSQIRVGMSSASLASDGARRRMQAALLRLRGIDTNYDPSVSVRQAHHILRTGAVSLTKATPSTEAADVFRKGVSTWSMPYRSREGRSSRFVLYGKSGETTAPVGILEVADDAPHNPLRDRAAGFATDFSELSSQNRAALADRLFALRSALRTERLPVSPNAQLDELVPLLGQLREAGRGRNGGSEEVSFRKRLTYLARLVGAEAVCRGYRGADPKWFAEGLRAIRDLALPRVHMEMSICGALPPFGPLLAGKLVASMAAHPMVRAELDRPFGQISRGLFHVDALNALFPVTGPLILTTKGLYPGHSAQYTGVKFPSASRSQQLLKKWGDTKGQTTSQISDRTMRLASRVAPADEEATVSRVYGSGGAKRQRTLERAAIEVGLPGSFVHAQVSRPVYGVSLCSNVRDVLLYGDEPEWLVEPYGPALDAGHYEDAAFELWRDRWLPVAERRLERAGE